MKNAATHNPTIPRRLLFALADVNEAAGSYIPDIMLRVQLAVVEELGDKVANNMWHAVCVA
jgi:hypothetical protein